MHDIWLKLQAGIILAMDNAEPHLRLRAQRAGRRTRVNPPSAPAHCHEPSSAKMSPSTKNLPIRFHLTLISGLSDALDFARSGLVK